MVALIGESGSGKTTIALSLLGYARAGCRSPADRSGSATPSSLRCHPSGLARLRGRQVGYVAQSAAASFNPSQRDHGAGDRSRAASIICCRAAGGRGEGASRCSARWRLPDPEHVGERFPHQVSGGQLQRLMAAMALITDPELVIMDEPTTALDVTTQIEVLRAFKKVVREQRTTALYVSHDLAVVAQIADRIIVLRDGVIQEDGTDRAHARAPTHAYTQSLLAAADPGVARQRRPRRRRADTPLLRGAGADRRLWRHHPRRAAGGAGAARCRSVASRPAACSA